MKIKFAKPAGTLGRKTKRVRQEPLTAGQAERLAALIDALTEPQKQSTRITERRMVRGGAFSRTEAELVRDICDSLGIKPANLNREQRQLIIGWGNKAMTDRDRRRQLEDAAD